MSGAYERAWRRSIEDPEGFWGEAAEAIDWTRRWDRVLDDSRPPFYRWFRGGETNTCHNALDRHVAAGHGERTALVYDSPVTGRVEAFSYADLLDRVARAAGGLARLGVGAGDRVLIYMPMIPEAVVTMLACARLGAVHSVVFGGFASSELASRIDDATPKVVVSASCGIEPGRLVDYKPLLDGALELASHAPAASVVVQRPEDPAELVPPRDIDWADFLDGAEPAECVPVAATDPLYVLYTSGTTGTPKGIVRDTGGHLVSLQWSFENVYGMKPGEVFWAASDIGWVVGHSYIVYAPLFHGCTTVLYEGKPVGTPDAGAFWRVASQHGVDALFTAPTALRGIKREDPEAALVSSYDLSRFRTLFLAGERADPDTVAWAERALGVPVIDHWWQTESGWPMASNCMGLEPLPVKHGSPTRAVPGWDIRIVDDQGAELPATESGVVVVKLPLPPGCLPTLWQAEEKFREKYLTRYPGYFETGDAGYLDEDGYLWVMSRTDDVINVAGHRLSTGALEEALAWHSDVAECAVIGVHDKLKGQLPVGFVVLNAGVEHEPAEIVAGLVAHVREVVGPVASFKQVAIVPRLPKTRSGKVLRGTMRKIADAEPWKMPATIDDPVILDEITEALAGLGYPHPEGAD